MLTQGLDRVSINYDNPIGRSTIFLIVFVKGPGVSFLLSSICTKKFFQPF